MAKKATPTKSNLKNGPLEVEVIIPKEVLAKETHFKDVYNNGTLKYNFGDNLPEAIKDNIEEVIKSSKVEELIQVNPLLVSLEQLESFKTLKWDPEKENDRDFIDSNKIIGSFNSAVRDTTALMKSDADKYIKKVNGLRDFLLEEAKTTRSVLEENFKPFLEERERKKKEAADKKNAEMIKKNAELVKQNEEQANKLKNQMRESLKLHVKGEIGKITFSTASGVSVLNLEGLEKLMKDVDLKSFKDILSDEQIQENNFSEEEVKELKDEFDQAISSSKNVLGVTINNIKVTEQAKELQNENTLMKATQPSSILDDDDDLPFTDSNEEPNFEDLTDLDKISNICRILIDFSGIVETTKKQISSIEFEDEGLKKIQKIIAETSFQQIEEWSGKLVDWTAKKKDLYKEHLTQTT